MQDHGGELRYEDVSGGGARFTLDLPARAASAPSAAAFKPVPGAIQQTEARSIAALLAAPAPARAAAPHPATP